MKEEFIKLAKIARTEPEVIEQVSLKMTKITGKENVVEDFLREMEEKAAFKVKEMNLVNPTAEQVLNGLVDKLKDNDYKLFAHFQNPNFSKAEGYQNVLSEVKDIVGDLTGFYLKKEPALEFFRKNPPKKIMYALGYTDLEKMLAQEDWMELFAALRIVEDQDWVNKVFFAPYANIKADDFEQRDVQVLAMPDRWGTIAHKFEKKKLHHMSHLKEIGLVFVIPVGASGASGELIYLFFMTMHYLFEVDWHSKLFQSYSTDENFAQKMIEAIKVKVSEDPLPNHDKMSLRIVPSFLAKKNLADPRLKEPRVSPEDYHYIRAAQVIKKFAAQYPDTDLNFWNDLNYVAEIFSQGDKKELITFNMFDTGIALLKKAGIQGKYIYHQLDALWNELIIRYLGEEELNKLMMENLDKGMIIL